jgi:hypothetical protein
MSLRRIRRHFPAAARIATPPPRSTARRFRHRGIFMRSADDNVPYLRVGDRAGTPGLGSSVSPSRRDAMKRPRQRATVRRSMLTDRPGCRT